MLHFSIFCRCILEVFHRNFANSNSGYYIVLLFLRKKAKCNYFRVFLTNARGYRELKLLQCNTQILITRSFFFFSRKKAKCKIFGLLVFSYRYKWDSFGILKKTPWKLIWITIYLVCFCWYSIGDYKKKNWDSIGITDDHRKKVLGILEGF